MPINFILGAVIVGSFVYLLTSTFYQLKNWRKWLALWIVMLTIIGMCLVIVFGIALLIR